MDTKNKVGQEMAWIAGRMQRGESVTYDERRRLTEFIARAATPAALRAVELRQSARHSAARNAAMAAAARAGRAAAARAVAQRRRPAESPAQIATRERIKRGWW